ncbi:MAG: hypothetical protein GEV04_11045 [Actinophytocola sp.]|nr:hypothetical protein [Actinophytocola sp.]
MKAAAEPAVPFAAASAPRSLGDGTFTTTLRPEWDPRAVGALLSGPAILRRSGRHGNHDVYKLTGQGGWRREAPTHPPKGPSVLRSGTLSPWQCSTSQTRPTQSTPTSRSSP